MAARVLNINEAMCICFRNNAKVFPEVKNGVLRMVELVNGRRYMHKESYNTSNINAALESRYIEIANKL